MLGEAALGEDEELLGEDEELLLGEDELLEAPPEALPEDLLLSVALGLEELLLPEDLLLSVALGLEELLLPVRSYSVPTQHRRVQRAPPLSLLQRLSTSYGFLPRGIEG